MNIVVFGANGPTGRRLSRQALDAGHSVTAVTRNPSAFPADAATHVVEADVLDRAAVKTVISGQDAVLSALGVPFGRKPITLYSQSAAHIVRAMHDHGVRRLVCVTSSTMGPPHDTGGGFFFERVLKPFVERVIGKQLYADMARMEATVMASGLDWTIVRPAGLFGTETVTAYETAECVIRGRWTSRADLADCMLRQLSDDRYVGQAVALATVSTHPSLLDFIRKEALK
jgi:putative NADH-flavin reductase